MSKKSITFAAVFNTQTLKVMKNHIFSIILAAVCCAFVACNQNTPDDTKKGGDTTSLHQPSDPATWSPAGHIYVYETTWENSPASDNYWVWVLDFISNDSVIWYETYERDLSTKNAQPCERTTYEIVYPKLLLHLDTGRELTFTDTLTIHADIWGGFDYTILR